MRWTICAFLLCCWSTLYAEPDAGVLEELFAPIGTGEVPELAHVFLSKCSFEDRRFSGYLTSPYSMGLRRKLVSWFVKAEETAATSVEVGIALSSGNDEKRIYALQNLCADLLRFATAMAEGKRCAAGKISEKDAPLAIMWIGANDSEGGDSSKIFAQFAVTGADYHKGLTSAARLFTGLYNVALSRGLKSISSLLTQEALLGFATEHGKRDQRLFTVINAFSKQAIGVRPVAFMTALSILHDTGFFQSEDFRAAQPAHEDVRRVVTSLLP